MVVQSAVFGTSSSLPPLVTEGGGLVCESVGKVDLLLGRFDSKQSREAIDLTFTCDRLLVSPHLPSDRERSGVSC